MYRALNNPYVLVILATLLLSTGGAAIKAVDLSGSQIACARSGLGALALLVMMPSARRRWSGRTVLVGSALAATFVLFVHANRLTTAANTIFLQSTAPLYILFLSAPLLGERPRHRDLLFMGAVAVGATAFFIGLQDPLATAPDPAAGNLLAILSGLTWALTILGLRWIQLGPDAGSGAAGADAGSAGATVVCGNVIACLVSLPAALPFPQVSVHDGLVVLYLGVIQIGLAYVLLTAALKGLQALEASLFMLLEPVLNVLFAWWIHAESPGRWALAGGALILVSTALKSILDSRAKA